MSGLVFRGQKSTKQITVAELIEILKLCDQGALVSAEGCDCYGAANGVEVFEDGEVAVSRL